MRRMFTVLMLLLLSACGGAPAETAAVCTPGIVMRDEAALAERFQAALQRAGVQTTLVTVTRREDTIDCSVFTQRDTTIRVVVSGVSAVDTVVGALREFSPDSISPPPITLIVELPSRTLEGDYARVLDAYNRGERGQDLVDTFGE